MNKRGRTKVDPVDVYCRIRPLSDPGIEKCVKILDESSLMLQIPECSAAYRSGQTKQLVYSFTEIFDESVNQKQLFDQIGVPLVQDVLDGKNGLLFTYGVTGSGKTYSMMGTTHEPGLLQRSLDTIFNSISFYQCKKGTFKPDKLNSFEMNECVPDCANEKPVKLFPNLTPFKTPQTSHRAKAHADAEKLNEPGCKILEIADKHVYGVFISCIEIYNNYIYDLLDELASDSSKRIGDNKESKVLKEDTKGSMYIKDVVEVEVKSTEEALELMHRSQKKRMVAYTDLNAESSRSHSIFTIRIVQTPCDPLNEDLMVKNLKSAIHVSQLSLVDLAGSERTKRTNNTGSRLREAGNINSSLMALRNCIEALRDSTLSGSKKMVPYRDSKLTLLFKNYFEGNGKIKMVLCINPNALEFDETINVLKFSDLVKDVLIPVATPVKGSSGSSGAISLTSSQADCDILNQIFANFNNVNPLAVSFPPIDVFSSDDDTTIPKLVDYLEDAKKINEKRFNVRLITINFIH